MSDEKPDNEFWDRADEVIALANNQCNNAAMGTVSSSLLYAAARFNAFIVASMADDAEDMQNDKDKAIEYFTEQYKKMFTENFDNYLENYETYIQGGKSS